MAKVSLRAYNREIEGLIEHGQLDEAIAHCRHILKTFPKHLETYRLLGKTYLEAKRYNEAVDIFQRVLVAVPDDFVSHVGMSIIADDKGKLDEAIWHMERAFEVQPSNAAIQGELQRLFGRRDGVEPPKIRLTRGALAHMYVQGELYNQAVSEIRAVLGNDSKRTDMQVLLAKAYFRNGQKAEATEICSELLKRFLYCLDANRLMVEILPGTQRAESVQEYRQRVNELDPYAAFAQESIFHSENVADGAVNLERLEYSGQAVDTGASWGGAIGVEADATASQRGADQPEWLKAASRSDVETAPASQDKDEIPDFLRQAGWKESTGGFQEHPASYKEETEPAQPAVQGDLPDWVKALTPADESETTSQSTPSSADTPDWLRDLGSDQPAKPAASQESPDWLKNLGERELDEPVSEPGQSGHLRVESSEVQPPAPPSEEAPEWIKDFDDDLETPIRKASSALPDQTPQPSANLGALGTTAQEQDDAMAWLESLAAKHGAKPEELVTDPNARSDVAPEWVDKAKEIGEEASESTGRPAASSEEDKTGIWLRNLEASESEGLVSRFDARESTKRETSDWRSVFPDQNDFAQLSSEDEEVTPIMGEQETPDWLTDLGPKSARQPSTEDVPDWMRGTSTPPVQSESEGSQEPSLESAVNLPDWLAGLDKEETVPPSPTIPADDLPSWLQNEVEPEPQVTERARPADWQPVEPVSENPPVPEFRVAAEESSPSGKIPSRSEQKASVQVARFKPGVGPSKLGGAMLGDAQSELGRGNIAASLDIYGKLIRKGKSLEEIIRDLRDALYRYPVEVPIWQALGDAYMRANRLQEALDAYTKAEELLR